MNSRVSHRLLRVQPRHYICVQLTCGITTTRGPVLANDKTLGTHWQHVARRRLHPKLAKIDPKAFTVAFPTTALVAVLGCCLNLDIKAVQFWPQPSDQVQEANGHRELSKHIANNLVP